MSLRSHTRARRQERRSGGHRLVRRWVLVAEEDDQVRARVAEALRADGFDVTEAVHGFDLLDQISTALIAGDATVVPDAIVMGVWMHGVSGLTILKGLRDADWPVPIVLITTEHDPDLGDEPGQLLANAIFQEPFDLDDLRTVLLNMVPAWGTARDAGRIH